MLMEPEPTCPIAVVGLRKVPQFEQPLLEMRAHSRFEASRVLSMAPAPRHLSYGTIWRSRETRPSRHHLCSSVVCISVQSGRCRFVFACQRMTQSGHWPISIGRCRHFILLAEMRCSRWGMVVGPIPHKSKRRTSGIADGVGSRST